jgi:imidazoleglycerol-phosphate dehydratase
MPEPLAPRSAAAARKTAETDVSVTLSLDGTGRAEVATGVGFLDHMLTLLARHGGLDLAVTCRGDLQVDDHPSVEDVGIVIGQALGQALGDKAYVARYGHAYVPMDEALARAVVDLSGRFYLVWDADFRHAMLGAFPTEMAEHFFYSFAEQLRANLNLSVLAGRNDHHKIEALFKATARALRAAVSRDEDHGAVLSTKGRL